MTTTRVTVPTVVETHTCDLCKKNSSGVVKCPICGRDVCVPCGILHDLTSDLTVQDSFSGDHPYTICDDCWTVGEMYRNDIERIRKHADQEEAVLMGMWRDTCARKATEKTV